MITRILHFSDTHETAVPTLRSFSDKRILGCCNSLLIRKRKYCMEYFESAVPRFLAWKPDVFVFTGDAVSTAEPMEFARARERFQPLIDSSIPILYVPGNHDVYVANRFCRAAMEAFYETLNGRSYTSAPYVRELAGLRFALIHCARPLNWYFSCGHLTPETSAFLHAEAAKTSEKPLVCIGHFPILTEHPLLDFRRRLYGADAVADLVKTGKIALSCCGHIHEGYEKTNDAGYGEICAGSLTKHGEFILTEYDSETCRFHSVRHALPR